MTMSTYNTLSVVEQHEQCMFPFDAHVNNILCLILIVFIVNSVPLQYYSNSYVQRLTYNIQILSN